MGRDRAPVPHLDGELLLIHRWLVGALCVFLVTHGVDAQEVLLSKEQALHEIFPEGARFEWKVYTFDAAARARLEKSLGRPLPSATIEVTLVADSTGTPRGYAVITEERGKYLPITFMVGVTTELRVRDVAVLVYRESRGGDVKRKRFLAQYRGKRARDAIDSNRDIINISGATISVRSMNAGVKRVLAELTEIYGGGGAPGR